MGTHRLPQFTRRHEAATAGALVMIFAYAAYSWLVTPHVASLQASQQYERVAEVCAERSRVTNQRLRTERAHVQELTGQYASFSGRAFHPNKAEEFFSDLEAFCEQTGCVMASLSYLRDITRRPVAQEGGASHLLWTHRSVALTVHATYGNVIRLIEKLQARPQKVWIDALRMGPSDPGPGRVACDLVVTIYVNLEKESPDNEQAPMQP